MPTRGTYPALPRGVVAMTNVAREVELAYAQRDEQRAREVELAYAQHEEWSEWDYLDSWYDEPDYFDWFN